MNAKLIPFLLLFSAILCLNASAVIGPFTVNQPDGTSDTTSGYYTVVWTPMGPEFGPQAMIKDLNTISCWADVTNTAYSKTYQLISRRGCCDINSLVSETVYVGNLPGRNGGAYYVWCSSDLNSDMNDYSPGQFTLSRYGAGDFFGLSIDSVGGLIAAIARNIGPVALIIVVSIVLVLVLDLITGVFGIFEYIKHLAH